MRLLKAADLLDVVHEVPAVHILHHEVQAVLEESKADGMSAFCSFPGPGAELGRAGICDPNHQDAMTGPWCPQVQYLCHWKYAGDHRRYMSLLLNYSFVLESVISA